MVNSFSKNNNLLYLGSKSYSRKELLQKAEINFIVAEQDADETVCNWALSLSEVVASIARHKMDHVIIPDGKNTGDAVFIVTADTLSQSVDGVIQGKPIDRNDAIQKIKLARQGNNLCTAICVEKRVWNEGTWFREKRIERVVFAELIFDVPDHLIDWYLDNTIALNCSGGIQVENLGLPFLKSVTGSYTAIIGLPLFELREALEEVGFYN